MTGQIVYLLCALTSMGCTVLLTTRYQKTRVGLLFWSGLAFFAFTITNVLLFVDLVMVPDADLSLWRNGFTFAGVIVLLYGLIRNNT